MAADKAVKAKSQVDDILEECWAAVMDHDYPKAVFTGLGMAQLLTLTMHTG